MTKKTILTAAVLAVASTSAMAGGLLTNTNQNAAYVRQMAQDGIIDITGLYANPAGTAFLSNGWHLSLNSQTARQQRNIETTFPLFALNDGNAVHKFQGKAFAPVIPSFSLSYNKDKWSVNAHFALIGGGGKCEFDKGLGSFEALYAGNLYQLVPGMVNSTVAGVLPGQLAQGLMAAGVPEAMAGTVAGQLAQTADINSSLTGYGLNAYMKGRSYTFGLQLGGTYKFTDNLAGYVGVRLQYATNNYYGYVQDISAKFHYNVNVPANATLGFPGTTLANDGTQDLDAQSLTLNSDQSGFGAAPIIGLDYKVNEHWNFAARYEAPTKLNLKNKSEMNDMATSQAADPTSPLAQFADGSKARQDIPGLLSLGAMYSPIEKVRIMAGFHEFFDKSAKCYGDKQKQLDKNTWEVNVGVEYDVCKLITVSASFQNTKYGQSDAYMNDLSFNLSNKMIGGGLRINASKRCAIDLGYMYTFYKDRTVNDPKVAGKVDTYNRKNYTYGLGVNLAF